jgi:hypothetical protein
MGRKIVSGQNNKTGRLFIAGNEFCAEDWDIAEVGNEEDTTNTCGAGAAEQEIGMKRLEGTINYTWDVANNPWNNPPNLGVGTKHETTKLYINSTGGVGLEDGPFFQFTLHVLNHSNSIPIRGKVSGAVGFASHGTYILPTGNDSSGA